MDMHRAASRPVMGRSSTASRSRRLGGGIPKLQPEMGSLRPANSLAELWLARSRLWRVA